MKWIVKESKLSGTISIPPSKSHTIRALVIGALADGESCIEGALCTGDGASGLAAARGLGAAVDQEGVVVRIRGIGGDFTKGDSFLDLGNSGTSTRLFTTVAALGNRTRTFDGDASLRSRPMRPLLAALSTLGAKIQILREGSDIPFSIQGPIGGGCVTIPGITSQYLSSLLIGCPCAPCDTEIMVENLHEKPYARITLWWLDKMGIRHEVAEALDRFLVRGGQTYAPIRMRIPGDFSSATFPAVAAAITGSTVTLDNIDFTDPQGDKYVLAILEQMGAIVERTESGCRVTGRGKLCGGEIDCNSTPDALPALAIAGCFAEGTTRIRNVAQARIKETDRIAVMAKELGKMGGRIEELPDGMVIHQSTLRGASVDGWRDHRVVMALALAGMIARGDTVIEGAEASEVTYPNFARDFRTIGANVVSS